MESFKSKLLSNLRYDGPASIVVFFVAVPLCLGIALASGAPLFSGIIAGVVGGIVVGSISNSSLGVSGPAAGLTVIVLSAITKLGTFESFLTAVVLAGIIQIALGLVKAGIIGYYFPSSVIKGMLTAIGIIIILKQIPHAFGYDKDYEGDMSFFQVDGENTFTELVRMLDAVTPGAMLVCSLALVILITWGYVQKQVSWLKLVQAPLVAVVVGIFYQLITSRYFPNLSLAADHLVTVPVASDIKDFVGQFSTPDFSGILNGDVWLAGVTIALVASLESLLSVEATDKLDPQKRITNTNRELLAQGAGNMVSGLIGGLPVTQVILRSTANIQSGGKTKLSAILHGILLLVCVALVPGVLNMVPYAVLAAVLFAIGFKLAKPSLFKEMYHLGWSQFLPFMVTVVGIVMTDLMIGIGMGLATSIVIILKNSFNNSHFLHIQQKDNNGGKLIKMRLAEEVYFLNKGAILSVLNKIEQNSHVVIDLTRTVKIDHDVKEIIENFQRSASSKNIYVQVVAKSETDDQPFTIEPDKARDLNASINKKVV